MNLELVSDDRDRHSEASVKVSSRSNIRNPVKTPHVLQVSPWSLGGCGGSGKTWKQLKSCQGSTCPPSFFLESWRMWRFLKNFETAETLSRLCLSSKSFPGVLEDMEVPDEPGGGVI